MICCLRRSAAREIGSRGQVRAFVQITRDANECGDRSGSHFWILLSNGEREMRKVRRTLWTDRHRRHRLRASASARTCRARWHAATNSTPWSARWSDRVAMYGKTACVHDRRRWNFYRNWNNQFIATLQSAGTFAENAGWDYNCFIIELRESSIINAVISIYNSCLKIISFFFIHTFVFETF